MYISKIPLKFKSVLIEPDDAMMSAGCAINCKEPCYADCKNNGTLREQFKAMVRAAPENITCEITQSVDLIEPTIEFQNLAKEHLSYEKEYSHYKDEGTLVFKCGLKELFDFVKVVQQRLSNG